MDVYHAIIVSAFNKPKASVTRMADKLINVSNLDKTRKCTTLLVRTNQRLTTDPHFGKLRTAMDFSATGGPIHLMFGSRVGLSRSADRIMLYPTASNSKMVAGPPSWKFQMVITQQRFIKGFRCF